MIKFNSQLSKYELKLSDGQTETFDGVILCASPMSEDDINIETRGEKSLNELLGFEKNLKAQRQFREQERIYRSENQVEKTVSPISKSACSHFAVVVGLPNAQFFRRCERARFIRSDPSE